MDEAQGSAVQSRLEQSRQLDLPLQLPVVIWQLVKAVKSQSAVLIKQARGAKFSPTLRLDERKRENERHKGKGKKETRRTLIHRRLK